MKPLLNREFKMPEDGFFQVVPRGEYAIRVDKDQYAAFRNAAGTPTSPKLRVVQVLDAAACEAIAGSFAAESAAPGFAGLPLDYDHFSTNPERSSEVAGWITALQNRPDGVYAAIRWAGDGERKVATGAFRFISPVFEPTQCELVAADRVRPLRLAEAALTNKPNMRGIRPLTNRDPEIDNNTMAETARKGAMKEQIIAALKLAADASDEAVLGALQTLANRAEGVEKTNVDLAAECQALKNRVAEFERAALEAQVEADLEKFKNRIANRDHVKAALLANRAEALKLLEAVAEPTPAGGAAQKLLNRADGKPPVIESEEQKLANRRQAQETLIDQLLAEKRCSSRAAAYEIAQKQKPDLFA